MVIREADQDRYQDEGDKLCVELRYRQEIGAERRHGGANSRDGE